MRTWLWLPASVLLLVLPGCPFFQPPPHFTDPTHTSNDPGTLRGDSYDRGAVQRLTRRGAQLPEQPFRPEDDELVVREALRLHPPSAAGRPDLELRDASTLVFRRRRSAAFAAFTEHMRAPDPDVRAGAVHLFAELARYGPPTQKSGPEEEAALTAAAALLSDRAYEARKAAVYVFEQSLGPVSRPSWQEVLALLAAEQDAGLRDLLLRVPSFEAAPARVRLEAVGRFASDSPAAWRGMDGLLVAENRESLETAFRTGPPLLRGAIARELDDISLPGPWAEGLMLLVLADPDPVVRENAAHAARHIVPLTPALRAGLARVRSSSPWAEEVLATDERTRRNR